MTNSHFTVEEKLAASRFLYESGIARFGSPDGRSHVDTMIMIGYLSSVIRALLLDYPSKAVLRIAAARCRMFERAAHVAAVISMPICSPECAAQDDDRPCLPTCPTRYAAEVADAAGLLYSRADEPAPTPVEPPPGVDGLQLGTRAVSPPPVFLDGPPLPVCMVDATTLFCQTHQGVHVAEDAQIFDVLAGGQS